MRGRGISEVVKVSFEVALPYGRFLWRSGGKFLLEAWVILGGYEVWVVLRDATSAGAVWVPIGVLVGYLLGS